jgi:radical SAM superfamily enzyme YgiQ (UPF0313 family)
MRILLVRPKPPNFTIGLKNIMVCEPLELEYLAAAVEKHEVEIFDMILEDNFPDKIKSFNPDILGTSSYITGINKVKEICRTAKNINGKIHTVVGGVHATLAPEDFKDESIDTIIKGEGIWAFSELVDKIQNGEDVKNTFLQTGDDYFKTDVDRLPYPNRSLTKKFHHRYYYLFHQPVTIVKTSFGCPFTCNFCYCWKLTNGKVYNRSPESVINELLQIENKDIYIVDDTFFVSRKHVMDIHKGIQDNNIKKEYLVYGHADFIANNPDVIEAWSEVGLKACIIGLESPKEKELIDFEKKTTIEINNKAIRVLQDCNVDIYASFIVAPNWSKQDFVELKHYIFDNKLYYIVIQPLTPLPGTEVFEKYNNYIVRRNQFELWDMQHAVLRTAMDEKEFYKEIRKIYISTVFNPIRIMRLKLRTAPPLFSRKYLRMLSGCFQIYKDLKRAHRHKNLT